MMDSYHQHQHSLGAGSLVSWPIQLLGWLLRKPSSWFSSANDEVNNGLKSDQMTQHRLVGGGASSTLLTRHSNGTLAYHKSQFQNGYTTSLGLHQAHNQMLSNQQVNHQHQRQVGSTGSGQSAMPLNASSNSSYVSSSAYYEEIGATNSSNNLVTRVNANSPTLVMDPFRRQDNHFAMAGSNQQQQWRPINNSGTISYSMEPQKQAQQQTHLAMINKQHLHTDLSPLQSSSSSSTGSASVVTGNTTPRHYLFASPSAVSAYKQQQHQHLRGPQHQHQYHLDQ